MSEEDGVGVAVEAIHNYVQQQCPIDTKLDAPDEARGQGQKRGHEQIEEK
jgi:hypothetical protein